MISKLLLTLIPTALFFGTILVLVGFLYLFAFSRKGRRTPLTRELLRSPGESLRKQIEDLGINIDSYLMIVVAIPVVMFSTYLSQTYLGGNKQDIFSIIIYMLGGVIFFAVIMVKLWRQLKQRRSLYLALDCELAVGQELNQLMLNGCMVFHDFPADKFNIDHVVVGPKGVFAVETKGRAKPDKEGGTTEATVTYDGEALKFPNGTERGYLDQAKRQAGWLSKWLSNAVGEQISVQPVLALPGWFIQLAKPTGILVFNGKNPDLLLKWCRDDALSPSMIKRIVHQIDQRCRDVEPAAYKKQ